MYISYLVLTSKCNENVKKKFKTISWECEVLDGWMEFCGHSVLQFNKNEAEKVDLEN